MLPASVVLVNYRSPELVVGALRHLESLGTERPEQTIVVDNSPEEGLGHRLAANVDYVASPGNVGFAGGVNLGLQYASQEVVVLLNPDAIPEPSCLTGMVETLLGAGDVGVVAPMLLPMSPDAPVVPSATRRDPGFLTALVEHTILRRFLSPTWLDRHYFIRPGATPGPTDAAMVQGACFAFRRELLDRIGLFDEKNFFLYWEETDFCRRARQAGWRVLLCPQVCCRHLGGGSTPEADLARRHFWWGLLAYHRRYHGVVQALLLRSALLVGITAEICLLSVLRLWRPGDRELRADLAENRRRIVHLLATRPPERPV